MTFEELRKKAKEMGAEVFKDLIVLDGKFFWSYGVVELCDDDVVFAKGRTPEQMLMIMEALR